MIRATIQRLRDLAANGFVRSVGVLVSGTIIAQIIVALALPIVTRLYSPSDFSLLALFTAITYIISVAACLRFDIAIPIAETDAEAINVFSLAVTAALLIALILALLVLFEAEPILRLLNEPRFASYLWLIPIAVFLASMNSALQNWFVRRQAFRGISAAKIIQAGASSVAQIGIGVIRPTALGLLVGFTIFVGAGCLWLGRILLGKERTLFGSVSFERMKAAFRKHSLFPKYSTFEALCNNASIYLPVVLISAWAIGPEAGYVLLAMQVMQAPMALIGAAVAQVYFSRAPEEFRAGSLGNFTAGIFGGLMRSGVGPLLFAGLVAPEAFSIVFGKQWRPAGELVAWMTPWFIMQLLSSPLSVSLHVTGNLALALVLQVFGLVVRVGMLYGASLLARGHLSEAYAISGFVFYFVYTVLVLRVSSVQGSAVMREVRRSLPITAAWLAAGLVVALSARFLLGPN